MALPELPDGYEWRVSKGVDNYLVVAIHERFSHPAHGKSFCGEGYVPLSPYWGEGQIVKHVEEVANEVLLRFDHVRFVAAVVNANWPQT